jgi:hypothetical protein
MPVLICVFAMFAAGFLYFIPYRIKSRSISRDLNQAAGRPDKQKRCSIQNLQPIETRVLSLKNETLNELWDRYRADIDTLFDGTHVPEPGIYFTYDDIFDIPCGEKSHVILPFVFSAFGLLSFLAPVVQLFFTDTDVLSVRLRASLAASGAGVLIAVGLYIITFVLIRRVKLDNTAALRRFNNTLAAHLPVMNQATQGTLMLKACRENTEAFKETAKAIAEKIDDFAVKGIAPVVADAFKKSIERFVSPGILGLEKALFELSNTVVAQQEKGMRELAAAFAGSLNDTISTQIKAMSEDMAALLSSLRSYTLKTEETVSGLLDSLGANSAVLRETADIGRAIAAEQETTTRNIGEASASLIRAEQVMGRLEKRDADVFTGLSASYDRILELQGQLRTQLQSSEDASKTVSEAMLGASAAVSESAISLIAATGETSERTYQLVSDKLSEVLAETAASNAGTCKSVEDAVQSLIAAAGETSNLTYGLISEKLTEMLDAAAAANAESGKAIRETAELLIDETGKNVDDSFERVFTRLTELLTKTNDSNAETYGRISHSVETLASTVGQTVGDVFTRYSGHLIDMLDETAATNKETSQKLASTMTSLAEAGTEQYEKAAQAAAQLLDNVVIEMNKAMDGVGHEIADSIREASIGSAEIVSRLAEKTAQLKQEYDVYFSRIETQSLSNLSEIEFRVQNIFARFSNDATDVMDRLEGNISRAAGLFEGNTTMLLQSMEEQSRSIGLYAKEINIDVASLTGSLRDSVSVFTEQMQSSTHKTFEAFDEGLSQISARLANTVESIRETVENLPSVIRQNNGDDK